VRAVTIRAPGGPEVLELREVPEPRVPAFHVGVRVRAVGVNRADLLQRAGHYPAPAGVPADIPGLELVGEIDELGEGATARALGERVYGLVAGGAYAERVVMHEREAVPVPEGLGDVEAAAVPEAFVTALDALTRRARLAVGEQVLVHAAGSGVGTAAVQLAKLLGAGRVVGTSRTADKLARARALGLDVAVVAREAGPEGSSRASGSSMNTPSGGGGARGVRFADEVRAEVGGVDVVLDLVGGPYVRESIAAARAGARLVLVGLVGGAHGELDLRPLLQKRLTLVGTVLRSRPLEERIEAASLLGSLSTHLARRALVAVVAATFPLARAGEAHALVAAGGTFGKVVLEL
jgi:NADPH2:quinone reductase